MLFDLDLIRTVYGTFANRVDAARKAAGTPLTLTEKILYAHLFDADGADYDRIREDDRISVTGLKTFAPGSRMTITLLHSDGTSESFEALHTYNEQQIGWFRAGSALNS